MLAASIPALTAALMGFSLTSATCILKNERTPIPVDLTPIPQPEGSNMCVPQAEGNYHLSYTTDTICVPTLSGANSMAGCSSGGGFYLYDWNCNIIGAYNPGLEDDCGIPYRIDYFPGKPITINNVWLSTERTSFGFDFDGRHYSTQSNGNCNNRMIDKGLRPVANCRVGFAGPPPCTLKNVRSSPSGSITEDSALCTKQADGNVQVTMETADPPTISIYDSECREVAFFRRDSAPDFCPWPIKIDHLGGGKEIYIKKWDANQRKFSFDFRGQTFEGNFEKTQNDVSAGLGEYASKSGIYVL